MTETNHDPTVTAKTAAERVTVPRRAGVFTDHQITEAAKALAANLTIGVDTILEVLDAAEQFPLEVEYNCDQEDDSAEAAAFSGAVKDHLLRTGALAAAVRHAFDVATEEVHTQPEQHLTNDEISALVVCSDVCGRIPALRPHLSRDEQRRLSFHVARCAECGTRTRIAVKAVQDILASTVRGAMPGISPNELVMTVVPRTIEAVLRAIDGTEGSTEQLLALRTFFLMPKRAYSLAEIRIIFGKYLSEFHEEWFELKSDDELVDREQVAEYMRTCVSPVVIGRALRGVASPLALHHVTLTLPMWMVNVIDRVAEQSGDTPSDAVAMLIYEAVWGAGVGGNEWTNQQPPSYASIMEPQP